MRKLLSRRPSPTSATARCRRPTSATAASSARTSGPARSRRRTSAPTPCAATRSSPTRSTARAAKADDADTLGGLGPDAFVRKRADDGEGQSPGGERYVAHFVADGEEWTVAEAGGLRLYARCDIDSGRGYDDVFMYIASSEDNAAFDDNNGPEGSDFDAGEEQEVFGNGYYDGGPDIEVTSSGSGVTGLAADGSVLAFNDYALGVNIGGRQDSCFVSGTVTIVKAS